MGGNAMLATNLWIGQIRFEALRGVALCYLSRFQIACLTLCMMAMFPLVIAEAGESETLAHYADSLGDAVLVTTYRIGTKQASLQNILWQPDGDRILCILAPGGVGLLSTKTSTFTQILPELPGGIAPLEVSPIINDTAYVVLADSRPGRKFWFGGDIWSIDLSENTVTRHYRTPDHFKYARCFSHDGRVGAIITVTGNNGMRHKSFGDLGTIDLALTESDIHSELPGATVARVAAHGRAFIEASAGGRRCLFVKEELTDQWRVVANSIDAEARRGSIATAKHSNRFAAYRSGTIEVFEFDSQGTKSVQAIPHDDVPPVMSLSAGGDYLACGYKDGSISIFAIKEGEGRMARIALPADNRASAILGLEFSPSGNRLAVAHATRSVSVIVLRNLDWSSGDKP
jgi:WD40 repeat protein